MAGRVLTRRGALAGLGGVAASGLVYPEARAATTLTIISHEVNKASATTGKGGDVLAAWRQANNCEVSWITLDVPATTDRYLREASLGRTTVDLAFQTYTTARVLQLSDPLDPYLASDPIPGVGDHLEDLPPALVKALQYQGTQRGIPARVSVEGLAYNLDIFAERGVTALPKTFEELVEVARKVTFTRADGSKVYGMMFTVGTQLSDGLASVARCFGGDYVSPDMKIRADESSTVKSLEALAQMYKEGLMPAEMITCSQEDVYGWMRQGRCAMSMLTAARLPGLNDPKGSKYPGKIEDMPFPMTESLAGRVPFQAQVESWSMVMPTNGAPERRKLAWSFIQELSKTDTAVRMALNGNGPARLSAYKDPRLAGVPFLQYIGSSLGGHPSLPPFTNEAKVNDFFVAECQLAILGRKSARQAMDDAVVRVKPLIG